MILLDDQFRSKGEDVFGGLDGWMVVVISLKLPLAMMMMSQVNSILSARLV